MTTPTPLPDILAELHAASFPDPWSADEFATLLANPFTHVVTSDTGFALMQIVPPEAELISISVIPVARRNGAGQHLLTLACDRARKTGATHMHLEVATTNVAARALYARAGFSQIGERAGYYAHPDSSRTDALVLQAPLT